MVKKQEHYFPYQLITFGQLLKKTKKCLHLIFLSIINNKKGVFKHLT